MDKVILSNHLQCVVVDGSLSSPSVVTSGVPQRSMLGPTFFLLHINDLNSGKFSTVKLFSDDLNISNNLFPLDHLFLQEDLSNLSLRENKWQMKFNIEKCMQYFTNVNHQHKSSFAYSMLGLPLKTVKQHI